MAKYLYRGANMTAIRSAIFDNLKIHRGERNVIIVPDQYSFTIEQEVLKQLGAKCAFDIDVVSFSRLAEKVVKDRSNTLNKQTSVMLMRRVILEISDKLKCYKRASKLRGYANEAYAVITNIRNSGVTPEELERIIPKLKGGIRAKTEDITAIYKRYCAHLDNYRDMTGMLEMLLARLDSDPSLSDINYYITDFYDMADIKLRLVAKMLEKCANIYIGAIELNGVNKRIAEASARIAETALKYGAKVVNLPSGLTEEKQIVADNIFGFGVNALKNGSADVEIKSFANYEKEIEYIAEDVRRNVIRNNYRYKDIAVVAPDNRVSDMIERVFKRYEIPCYIDVKYPLVKHTLHRALVYGYSACNLSRQNVLNLVKEPCFRGSVTDKDAFENYIIKYNIDGAGFMQTFDEEAAEELRIRALNCIGILSDVIDVDGFISGITGFYEQLNTDIDESEIGRQIMPKLLEITDNIEKLFGGTNIGREQLYDAMFTAAESVEIATVPMYIDSVTVGDSADSRFGEVRILYMSGADEGAYPRVSSDLGMIREKECRAWAELGVRIESANDRNKLIKLGLQQLLMKPEKTVLTSTRSRSDSLMKIQLKKMLNLTEASVKSYSYINDEEAIAERIATRYNYDLLLSSEKIYVEGEAAEIRKTEKYAKVDTEIAFYQRKLSPSSLEKFYLCPYRYFAEKILRIKKREEAAEEANILGTFMHETLELYYNNFPKGDKELKEKVKSICKSLFIKPTYAVLMKSADSATLKKMLIRRSVYAVQRIDDMFADNDFSPAFCEYRFGGDSENKGLEINVKGKSYFISGIVDRVDTAVIADDCGGKEKYICVVDYKSSEKKCDEGRLRRGLILQLPVYGKIVSENLGAKIAGLLYAVTPTKYSKDSLTDYCTGIALDNDKVLFALDRRYENHKETILPYRSNSSAPRTLNGKLNAFEIEDVIERAVELMKNAVEIIDEYELKPLPIDRACDYCDYKGMCRGGEIKERTLTKA